MCLRCAHERYAVPAARRLWLVVSVVGLGCNNFGPRIDLDATREVVDAALDAGVTLFDTADSTAPPRSSSARCSTGRRDDVVLATKFGLDVRGANGADQGRAGRAGTSAARSSARCAGCAPTTSTSTSCTAPTPHTPIEETLARADRARARGQGPLHRLLELRGLAGGRRRLDRPHRRPRALRQRPERVQPPRAGRRGRTARRPASASASASLPVLPAGQRPAHRQVPTRRTAAPKAPGCTGRTTPASSPTERFDRIEALAAFADERGVTLLEVAIGGLAAQPGGGLASSRAPPGRSRSPPTPSAGAWVPSSEDLAALDQVLSTSPAT